MNVAEVAVTKAPPAGAGASLSAPQPSPEPTRIDPAQEQLGNALVQKGLSSAPPERYVEDPVATAATLRQALLEGIREDQTSLAKDPAGAGAEDFRRRIRQRRAALQEAAAGGLPMNRIKEIARRGEIDLEPSRKPLGLQIDPAEGPSYTGRGKAPGSTTKLSREGLVWSGTSEQAKQPEKEGETRASIKGGTTTIDLRGVSVTSKKGERVTSPTGAETTTMETSTGTVKAEQGELRFEYTGASSRKVTTEEGATTETTTTAGVGGSLISSEEGLGAGARGRAEVRRATPSGTELALKSTADGRFVVKFERDEDPEKYRITITARVGGAIGGGIERSAEKQAGLEGSTSLGGEAAAEVTWTRILTASEASQLLGANIKELESGKDESDRAAYGLEARLRALRLVPEAADILAFASATAAKGLDEGESVQLRVSAGGDIGLEGGAKGAGGKGKSTSVGVELGAGATAARTIKVAKSRGKVVVTVTVADETRLSGGVTVGVTGGSFGLKGKTTGEQGSAFTFALDPANTSSYEQVFPRLRLASSAAELEKIALDHPDMFVSRTRTWAGTQTTTTSGRLFGVGGADVSEKAGHRHSVKAAKGGRLEGTTAGSSEAELSLSILETKLVSGGTKEAVKGTVGAEGIELDLSKGQFASDLTHSIRDTGEEFEKRKLVDNATYVATQGVGGVLKSLFERTYTHLSGYNVGPPDVERIVERAADVRRWQRAVVSPRLIWNWMGLRVALREPDPPAEWIEADGTPDHRVANDLYRAMAISTFIEMDIGGYDCIERVLRRWGETMTTYSQAEQLGARYEWPESLASTRLRFEETRDRVAGAESRLERLATPPGEAEGRRLLDDLDAELASILGEIKANRDFRSPRAQAEMIDTLQGLLRETFRQRSRFEARLAGRLPGPAFVGPLTLQQAAAVADERQAQLKLENRHLVEQLGKFKLQEDQLFAAAMAVMPQRLGGALEPGFLSAFRADQLEALRHLEAMRDLWRQWIRIIKRLRASYASLGVPASEWVVSPTLDAPRNPRTEPDIKRHVQLWLGAQKMGYGVTDTERFAATFTAMGRY